MQWGNWDYRFWLLSCLSVQIRISSRHSGALKRKPSITQKSQAQMIWLGLFWLPCCPSGTDFPKYLWQPITLLPCLSLLDCELCLVCLLSPASSSQLSCGNLSRVFKEETNMGQFAFAILPWDCVQKHSSWWLGIIGKSVKNSWVVWLASLGIRI